MFGIHVHNAIGSHPYYGGTDSMQDDKEPEIYAFVENARILENEEILFPGAIVHIEGRE